MLGCAQIALPPVLGVGPTAFGNIPVDPFAALGEVQGLAQGGESPVRQDRRPGADLAVQGVDLVAPQRLKLLLALAGQDMPGPVAFLLSGMPGRTPDECSARSACQRAATVGAEASSCSTSRGSMP